MTDMGIGRRQLVTLSMLTGALYSAGFRTGAYAAAGPGLVEIVADDEIWIKYPHADLGPSHRVIAFQLRSGVGGYKRGDTGAPWEELRRVGVYALPNLESRHDAAERLVISDEKDTGSRDYAIRSRPTGLYAGSYHGGVRQTSISGADLRDGQSVGTVKITRSSVLMDRAGNTAAVNYVLILHPDGSLTDVVSASSNDLAWTERSFSHENLADATHYGNDGESWTEAPVGKKVSVPNGPIWLRSNSTGIEVCVECDAHALSSFKQYTLKRIAEPNRIKCLNEHDAKSSVPLDIKPISRTSRWRRTAPNAG